MKQRNSDFLFIISLVALSVALYCVHFLIFRDIRHITIFSLGDLAFVPIEVICVSLIFHRILNKNEKKERISKLYMVIEMFFSEIGTELLRAFSQCDEALHEIKDEVDITAEWKTGHFKNMERKLMAHEPKIEMNNREIEAIDMMLQECRPQMLDLLGNPTLHEHETFTELLMAVFHLTEELRMRYDFSELTQADRDHLIGDAKRAYLQLGLEWINYVDHVRVHYPYLYSLCIRINPYKAYREVEIPE